MGNLKRIKWTQIEQNTYKINMQDNQFINLTKIKLNNDETGILAAGYKYN